MLKGVAVQGLIWEFYKAVLGPPCSSSKAVYHLTSDIQGEQRSGESLNRMIITMYEKSGGLNPMTIDMLKEERSFWV